MKNLSKLRYQINDYLFLIYQSFCVSKKEKIVFHCFTKEILVIVFQEKKIIHKKKFSYDHLETIYSFLNNFPNIIIEFVFYHIQSEPTEISMQNLSFWDRLFLSRSIINEHKNKNTWLTLIKTYLFLIIVDEGERLSISCLN